MKDPARKYFQELLNRTPDPPGTPPYAEPGRFWSIGTVGLGWHRHEYRDPVATKVDICRLDYWRKVIGSLSEGTVIEVFLGPDPLDCFYCKLIVSDVNHSYGTCKVAILPGFGRAAVLHVDEPAEPAAA